MKKIIFLITLILSLIFTTTLKAKTTDIPKGLKDKGPLTKITFIHHKKGYAKPPWAGNGKDKGGPACYGFLAKDAKWKIAENYIINTTNSDLAESFVNQAFDASVTEWENYGGNIFGDRLNDLTADFNFNSLDNQNVVVFDAYPNPDVIAVTSIWGYFYGNPKTRELVEWDMLFNTYFNWGDANLDPVLMDLQNIATHELGHSAGLDDLYETSCSLETMYGYSIEGEILKRNLNLGDITGIQKLYN